MSKKVGGGNGAHKAKGKRERRRLGPETYPTDLDESSRMAMDLRREALASGDLVVDMPTHIVLGDPEVARFAIANGSPADPALLAAMAAGQEIDRVPETWVHDTVGRLGMLARLFVMHAREHAHAEAAAVGHILTAVHRAVMVGDLDELNATGGPHTWARRYMRDSGLPIAIEDGAGKVQDMDQISGAFEKLAGAIEWGINVTRAAKSDLDARHVTKHAALVMLQHFPSLESLRFPDEPDQLKQIAAVTMRIAPRLRKLGEQRRTEPANTLAPDIAQDLLEREHRLSGRSENDVRRAFKFRNH